MRSLRDLPAALPFGDNMANMEPKGRILVVDTDNVAMRAMIDFLRLQGFAAHVAVTFDQALKLIAEDTYELMLCDINPPGGGGFELLELVRRRHPETVVMMMTGYGTIESAVEAIKLGAHDYLTKPIHDAELRITIERALAQRKLLQKSSEWRREIEGKYGLHCVKGHDYRMQRLFELMEAVAASKVTVLVQGPSGTGKSLVARVIHQLSDRRDQPFVEVSCGALPETLLESELFGHMRGAFTGAVSNKPGKFRTAHNGTIFLDEVATASPTLQTKLLRVLQSSQFESVGSNRTETVDVRVILATNADLDEEVREGRFRPDLFYRINVVTLDVPALADRVGDIPLLARHFLAKACTEAGRVVDGIDAAAMRLLECYNWPGNVRELENVITRAVVLCRGRTIGVDDLPLVLTRTSKVACPSEVSQPQPLRKALEQPERAILEAALRENGWNRQATARQLGINRTTLYKKMKRFGLNDEPLRTR